MFRGSWQVEGCTETDDSLNSGVEGEWRLQGEVEGGSREFAMREWGNKGRWGKEEGGEWDLRSGAVWGKEGVTMSEGGDTDHDVTEELKFGM